MTDSTLIVTDSPLAILFDPADARSRLMLAMAESIREKGFPETVVADVVRIARVSRRTFYEHFSDREDCLLQLCDATTSWVGEQVRQAMDPDLPWREQVENAVNVYMGLLAAQPQLMRSFLFEIYVAGERGMRQHRAVQRRYAQLLCDLSAQIRERHPQLNPVDFPTASAIVAGIAELAVLAVEDDPTESLEHLGAVANRLVVDVLTAPRD